MTNRIDNMQWSGLSSLPDAKPVKEPKYYIDIVSLDNYESDIYFVNNTNKVLKLLINSWLEDSDAYQQAMKGVIPSKIKDEWVYKDIQPKQGVKVGSQHIIYSSDGLGQIMLSIFETPNKIWKFNIVVKGLFDSTVLIWENDELPKAMITSTEKLILDDEPVDLDKKSTLSKSDPVKNNVR